MILNALNLGWSILIVLTAMGRGGRPTLRPKRCPGEQPPRGRRPREGGAVRGRWRRRADAL